jgi:uncharacterized membrane protein
MNLSKKRILSLRRIIRASAAGTALAVPGLAHAAIESDNWPVFVVYFGGIFLGLFALSVVVGAIIARLRRPRQVWRYALTFAGFATVSMGTVFPLFGGRQVLLPVLGLIALGLAEYATRKPRAPAPDEPQ